MPNLLLPQETRERPAAVPDGLSLPSLILFPMRKLRRTVRRRTSAKGREDEMLDATVDVVKAALRADASLTPQGRERILQAVRGAVSNDVGRTKDAVRLVRRFEAAERLSLSLRSVDKLAATGILTKIHLPGRSRAAGFRLADVERLIGGACESN